jgi:acetyltransferase-like isoleucine patch superfamily enzyme
MLAGGHSVRPATRSSIASGGGRSACWRNTTRRAPTTRGVAAACALRQLFSAVGDGADIQPRFACDYGYTIRIGRNAFINYNCVFLDCAAIEIGDDLRMGPAVQLYTAFHPLDRQTRTAGLEYARPIRIGDGVWIGGGAIVLAGVTIGSVIGSAACAPRRPPGWPPATRRVSSAR